MVCWRSGRWHYSESRGEYERDGKRYVTGDFDGSGLWTIAGERRIRWQATQRESNPTLADIDGDGRIEVLATQYQNGEILDADGTSRLVLPLDRANRPVQNTSSPIAADMDGDRGIEIVYGATSGHLHAFRNGRTEIWRTEVGGEVRGGIALGHTKRTRHAVMAVAWHDAGVAAVSGDGTLLWQRPLPAPADVTPVICEMDGDDIVLAAAGDEIIALRLSNGGEVWRTRFAARTVAPAVGKIARSGPTRVIVGDAAGEVSVLDIEGNILSTWVCPFSHDAYRPIVEVGLADLRNSGRRQIVVSTAGGLIHAYEASGTPDWSFATREQERGIALGVGGRLAFADLSGDCTLHTVVAGQDGFIYALRPDGGPAWGVPRRVLLPLFARHRRSRRVRRTHRHHDFALPRGDVRAPYRVPGRPGIGAMADDARQLREDELRPVAMIHPRSGTSFA